MNLVRFQTPAYAFRVNNLLNEMMNQSNISAVSRQSNQVSVNITESEEHFMLSFAAPGFEKENFSIKHQNGLLTVKGEPKNDEEKCDYRRKEFSVSNFERSFNLPETVDHEKISAKYLNGILNVELPKKEQIEQKNEFDIDVQ